MAPHHALPALPSQNITPAGLEPLQDTSSLEAVRARQCGDGGGYQTKMAAAASLFQLDLSQSGTLPSFITDRHFDEAATRFFSFFFISCLLSVLLPCLVLTKNDSRTSKGRFSSYSS